MLQTYIRQLTKKDNVEGNFQTVQYTVIRYKSIRTVLDVHARSASPQIRYQNDRMNIMEICTF